KCPSVIPSPSSPIEGFDLTERMKQYLFAEQWLEEGKPAEELGLENDGKPLIYDLYARPLEEPQCGTWYHFDHSQATPSKVKDLVSRDAYLLFYRQRRENSLGGITQEKVAEYRKVKLEGKK
ncbi:CSN-associated deubiquitinating enzyme Ubp12, partial [Serendipita sp. 400]